jgi:hypothetical protein
MDGGLGDDNACHLLQTHCQTSRPRGGFQGGSQPTSLVAAVRTPIGVARECPPDLISGDSPYASCSRIMLSFPNPWKRDRMAA